MRIAALNDSDSEEEDDSNLEVTTTTKEARESEVFVLYNGALQEQKLGNSDEAENLFEEIIEHPFMQDAARRVEEENESMVHPGLQLLYSTYKNMAAIHSQRKDYQSALKYYIEAVKIDTTEVTVWYKIGLFSLEIVNYPLARLGFEQGLQCNPNHWPCLDNVITLLYTMNDYWYCLYYISKALQRDPEYLKGLALKEQIFKEDPYLKGESVDMFQNCDTSIFTTVLDPEEIQEFVDEGLKLREKRRELMKNPEEKPIQLSRPVSVYTWTDVGRSLLNLYHHARKADPPLSLGTRVDFSSIKKKLDESISDSESDSEMDISELQPIKEPSSKKETLLMLLEAEDSEPDARISSSSALPKQAPQVSISSDNQTVPGSISSTTLISDSGLDSHQNTSISSVSAPDIVSGSMTQSGLHAAVGVASNSAIPQSSSSSPSINIIKVNVIDTPSAHISQGIGDRRLPDTLPSGQVIQAPASSLSPSAYGQISANLPAAISLSSTFRTPGSSPAVSSYLKTAVAQPPFQRNIPVEVALHDHIPAAFLDKGKKRKRTTLEESFGRRKSARVRDTRRGKDEDGINLSELLQSYLPMSLCQVQENEDEDNSASVSELAVQSTDNTDSRDDLVRPVEIPITKSEYKDVKTFLYDCVENGGIIDLMNRFLICVAYKDKFKWCSDLTDVFVRVYDRVRQHIEFPPLVSQDVADERNQDMAKMTLVWCELKFDKYLASAPKALVSTTAPRTGKVIKDEDIGGEYFGEDLWNISSLVGFSNVLGDYTMDHAVRVYWLRARIFSIQGMMDEAIACFLKVIEQLKIAREEKCFSSIKLWNCKADNVISKDIVKKQQESLQRCQSLEETQKLYTSGDYGQVVDFLLETFNDSKHTERLKEGGQPLPERQSQLLLLIDSLFELENYEKCLLWGEVCFNEALQNYKNAVTNSSKEEWTTTVAQIFNVLNKILSGKDAAKIESSLPQMNLHRLVQNLISVIDTMTSVPDNATEMPFGTVFAWILFYRLLKIEEDKMKQKRTVGDEASQVSEEAISPSLTLLGMAHDCLGRHGWCTKSDGALLHFYLDIVSAEMLRKDISMGVQDYLSNVYEQCVYCLYGHPNKKTKAKHLEDHNAPQINLSWKRCAALFEFYKPSTVPEFDSYKTNTVSAELENLLRRISVLVPENTNFLEQLDNLTSYIEGNSTSPPSCPEDVTEKAGILSELYYLLADYYFKNLEHTKAIKFYMSDLCLNPERIDSWAGMSLSRMSQLEQRLNSTDLRMDAPLHKRSITALRCFKRVVEIDDSTQKIWIEYGSLAYQLHSHASRQLKMQKWFPFGEEMLQTSKDYKNEMICTAQNCYNKASEVDECEERWLQHYMMAKIAEKMKKNPNEYLKHYRQAAMYLYEDNASYPKKINYVTYPSRYTMEPLEIHYKFHASIVKLLLRDKDYVDFKLLDSFLDQAAESPFAKCQEKKSRKDKQRSDGTNYDNQSNNSQIKANESLLSKTKAPSVDHTYSIPKTPSEQGNSTGSTDEVILIDTSDVKNESTGVSTSNAKSVTSVSTTSVASDLKTDDCMHTSTTVLEVSATTTLNTSITISSVSASLSLDTTKTNTVASGFSESTVLDTVKTSSMESEVSPSTSYNTHPTTSLDSVEPPSGSTANADMNTIKSLASLSQSVVIASKEVTTMSTSSQSSTITTLCTTAASNIDTSIASSSGTSALTSSVSSSSVTTGSSRVSAESSEVDSTTAITKESVCESPRNQFEENSKMNAESDEVTSTTVKIENSLDAADKVAVMKTSETDAEISSTVKDQSDEHNISSEMDIFSQIENLTAHLITDIDNNRSQEDKSNCNTETKMETDDAVSTTASNTLKGSTASEVKPSEQNGTKIKQDLNVDGKSEEETVCEPNMEVDTSSGRRGETKTKTVAEEVSFILDAATGMLVEEKVGVTNPIERGDTEAKQDTNTDIPKTETAMEVDGKVSSRSTGGHGHIDIPAGESEDKKPATNLHCEKQENMETESSPGVEQHSDDTVKKDTDSKIAVTSDEKNTVLDNKDLKSPTTTPDKDTASEETDQKPSAVDPEVVPSSVKTSQGNISSASDVSISHNMSEEEKNRWRKKLIDKCIAAFHLCLGRYSNHYKAIYRLAYIYLHSPYHKSIEKCRNILLGHPDWQQLDYMPAVGLFAERKSNNVFQGIWRIPIQEIDRSGSFATHINRSVQMLLDVLKDQKEQTLLFHFHTLLNKVPDPGKKYMRDSERICHALQAYRYTLDCIEDKIEDISYEMNKTILLKFLMNVFKIWNHGVNKMFSQGGYKNAPVEKEITGRANDLFSEVYCVTRPDEVDPDLPVLDQAIKFCQHQSSISKTHQHEDKTKVDLNSPCIMKQKPIDQGQVFSSPSQPSSQSLSRNTPTDAQPQSWKSTIPPNVSSGVHSSEKRSSPVPVVAKTSLASPSTLDDSDSSPNLPSNSAHSDSVSVKTVSSSSTGIGKSSTLLSDSVSVTDTPVSTAVLVNSSTSITNKTAVASSTQSSSAGIPPKSGASTGDKPEPVVSVSASSLSEGTTSGLSEVSTRVSSKPLASTNSTASSSATLKPAVTSSIPSKPSVMKDSSKPTASTCISSKPTTSKSVSSKPVMSSSSASVTVKSPPSVNLPIKKLASTSSSVKSSPLPSAMPAKKPAVNLIPFKKVLAKAAEPTKKWSKPATDAVNDPFAISSMISSVVETELEDKQQVEPSERLRPNSPITSSDVIQIAKPKQAAGPARIRESDIWPFPKTRKHLGKKKVQPYVRRPDIKKMEVMKKPEVIKNPAMSDLSFIAAGGRRNEDALSSLISSVVAAETDDTEESGSAISSLISSAVEAEEDTSDIILID